MARGTYGSRLRRSGAIGALLSAMAVPAFAQEVTEQVIQVQPVTGEDVAAASSDTQRITVTGTRIVSDSYNSPSPMTVVTTEEADVQGVRDIATLLQTSTAAAGSTQITAALSAALASPPGGLGTQTLSLRGLGAQRTLVLLNGRRAGPAGTGGTVGPFDLNVIPLSTVERIDILKDGASSLYGSDAIAGVVNIITKTDTGGSIDFSYTRPEVNAAGEELQISATYGQNFGRGNFRITGDYYRQSEFDRGDRDNFNCGESYWFNLDGSRADYVDPRTGNYRCSADAIWGHNWTYNFGENWLPTGPGSGGFRNRPWQTRLGLYQYDFLGNLGQYVPSFDSAGIPAPSGIINPPGWFPVGYQNQLTTAVPDPVFGPFAYNSAAVVDYFHPFMNNLTLSPQIERTSVFATGEYELTNNLTAYGEVLLNRRKTKDDGYRQFYTFQYLYRYGDSPVYGDPVAQDAGWSLRDDSIDYYYVFLSPTGIMDWADTNVEVDYTRFVGGLRGDLGDTAPGWSWDVSAQFSRSKGTYKEQILWVDAITDYEMRTGYCAGTTTRYRGVPCVDINWYSPDLLYGNLTQEEHDFLTGTTTSRTTYEQMTVEGYVTGPLFDLPAGPVSAVAGFLYQEDKLNDQPDQAWIDGEVWSGVPVNRLPTQGSDITRAAFMEFQVPLLADIPLVQSLDLSLSGRYTDVASYGGDSTYKVGLSWQVTDGFRIRGGKGTSFRTPGLYELFLQRQSSGLFPQGNDPCAQWGTKLANNQITQRQADNCAIDPKVPGGIGPIQLDTAGIQARTFTSGGFGTLTAETSESSTIGMIWQPSFADLQISVDYFDIEISGEVGRVSAGYIINECYDSPNFPNDPLCSLFTRWQPGEGATAQNGTLNEIYLNFLNIAAQTNRGVDFEARYRRAIPWGDLDVTLRASRQLESGRQLLPGSPFEEENGGAGQPKWVGNLNTSLSSGPWSVFWGVRYYDSMSEMKDYWEGRTSQPTFNGTPIRLQLSTPPVFYHSLSFGYTFEDLGVNARFGIRNLFDKDPPLVSQGAGFYRLGNSAIESQYDLFGRTYFLNVSKTF